jgi:RNA polymerase sigma-70 factor (ECF subfamily)
MMDACDEAEIDRWLEDARRGDERATDQLLEHYRPFIWRYLRGRVRSEEDCHDLSQEILLRVARALPRLVLHAPFEHWLMRIMANCVKRFYTQQSHSHETTFSDISDSEWLIEQQHESQMDALTRRITQQQTRQRLLTIAVEVCSDRERQVILLLEQGEAIGTIAQQLRMNLNTARSHLMRGRAKVLAHIVQFEPSLVGGTEAIEYAMEQLRQKGTPCEQLTEREHDSLLHPGRNQCVLRRACLKVAPYLWLSGTSF